MNKNNVLADELVNKTLWWRYSSCDEGEALQLSPALSMLFEQNIVQFDDMMGRYRAPIINIKVQEILNTPDADVRFVASYHTRQGKMSFQHKLHVYTDSGKRCVLANCMDVTEMVALEREIVDAQGRLSVKQLVERQNQLEEQNRIINESYQKQSRFLALLSHELRSPLLGISSLVQRLRLNETDEEVLSALKAIHITAEQSTFLVNDILTYSQTEYDEITLHPMEFSLKETLHNVKQLTRSIAADKGLIVSLIYLGKQDRVMGDSIRLSQVLINLIVNSIKFTQYGGVTIEVIQSEDNHFSFKITDSGEGIAEGQLERIFEPYAQLESIGSTQNIGSGLGLLVVQKLITLMGGEISVQSILGVGTSFSFDLFFHESMARQNEKEGGEEKGLLESTTLEAAAIKNSVEHTNSEARLINVSGDYPHVLIADDSKINLMVLGGYLQELNCSVVEAKNGREAWELFQKNTFDYVFLDIQMPFLDGIEVSHKIKACVEAKCEAAKNLKKVFAVTAGGEESNFTQEGEPVGSNGFDHWFVKPVSKEQIVMELQEDTFEQPEVGSDVSAGSDVALDGIEPLNAEKNSESSGLIKDKWEGVEEVPESFQRLINDFILDLSAGIEELVCLVQEDNVPKLLKKAHYLKGNCMLLQLNGMVSVLREIEEYAQKNKHLMGNKQKKMHFMLETLKFGLKYLEKSMAIRHNA